ncbi:hypothetical protein MA16_Dca014691 [Dendrobium catenatum]|uniref:Uncharacterized protein n=1 Tax=Dendrobium catenatum TaxID=906689 RepID=A0A2I0W8W8_9ASPA|nr:hypothetical protein MA16_Dca014691 [Dendrobium catenatum]
MPEFSSSTNRRRTSTRHLTFTLRQVSTRCRTSTGYRTLAGRISEDGFLSIVGLLHDAVLLTFIVRHSPSNLRRKATVLLTSVASRLRSCVVPCLVCWWLLFMEVFFTLINLVTDCEPLPVLSGASLVVRLIAYSIFSVKPAALFQFMGSILTRNPRKSKGLNHSPEWSRTRWRPTEPAEPLSTCLHLLLPPDYFK